MIGDTSLAETAVQNTWENTPTGPLKFAVIGSVNSQLRREEVSLELEQRVRLQWVTPVSVNTP